MISYRAYARALGLLLILLSLPACGAQTHDFNHWLADFKQEAAGQGISQAVLSDAFDNIEEPSEDILDLDRKQPEKTRLFPDYLGGVVTEKRIDAAKTEWQSNRALFDRLEKTYGVPAPILLSLWGIESNFGERQGDFSVVESLMTLAYDNRRSKFFRKELIAALRIIQQEDMKAEDLTGSWAGAMGQIQFMPSSYLKFAVDFDGDGRKDIWQNEADALASMANYLQQRGWNPGVGWGIQVELPARQDTDWQAIKGDKPLKEWQTLGVKQAGGMDLPQTAAVAHLVIPDDNPSVAFLAFSNYNVLMDWNHSIYFATSVGLLADAIKK